MHWFHSFYHFPFSFARIIWHFYVWFFFFQQVKSIAKEEDLDLQYFINKQGLQGTRWYLKGLSNADLLEENICAIFEAQFDKNGWKYKVQTITKFQGIIKSLYTCVFKKAHVFNETLSLEFAHVIVTKALE